MNFTLIIMLVAIVGMFWFSSRSNKKRQREEQQMRDSLAIGDEVTTIGGIIGKVISVKGETFVLETTRDCTRIRFLKGAIRSIDVKVEDIAATIAENSANDISDVPAEEFSTDAATDVPEDIAFDKTADSFTEGNEAVTEEQKAKAKAPAYNKYSAYNNKKNKKKKKK